MSAIVECHECGELFSDLYEICPVCGSVNCTVSEDDCTNWVQLISGWLLQVTTIAICAIVSLLSVATALGFLIGS